MIDVIGKPTRNIASTGDGLGQERCGAHSQATRVPNRATSCQNRSNSHYDSLAMEALDLEAQISANRRGVIFVLAGKAGTVECLIARAALEACFWLPPDADDAKTLKTFQDGANRIYAVAHRKLLAHPSARLELTTADFARG
ncbi:protein of unknown function (plasmid) [Caballeronia sp. S22]